MIVLVASSVSTTAPREEVTLPRLTPQACPKAQWGQVALVPSGRHNDHAGERQYAITHDGNGLLPRPGGDDVQLHEHDNGDPGYEVDRHYHQPPTPDRPSHKPNSARLVLGSADLPNAIAQMSARARRLEPLTHRQRLPHARIIVQSAHALDRLQRAQDKRQRARQSPRAA